MAPSFPLLPLRWYCSPLDACRLASLSPTFSLYLSIYLSHKEKENKVAVHSLCSPSPPPLKHPQPPLPLFMFCDECIGSLSRFEEGFLSWLSGWPFRMVEMEDEEKRKPLVVGLTRRHVIRSSPSSPAADSPAALGMCVCCSRLPPMASASLYWVQNHRIGYSEPTNCCLLSLSSSPKYPLSLSDTPCKEQSLSISWCSFFVSFFCSVLWW
jgi:hypothetical protein